MLTILGCVLCIYGVILLIVIPTWAQQTQEEIRQLKQKLKELNDSKEISVKESDV